MASVPDSAEIPIVRTVAELRGRVKAWRAAGAVIGLVPTMGGLHDGHLALVRAALAACGRVVVSIFVNPTQFGPGEDFARYPRNETQDAKRLAELGVHLLFAPSAEHIYPDGFATTVTVKGMGEGLCGAHRPGHFDGVGTVVAKLLLAALPDVAYFGEKDYQQLQVIKRLVLDLDIPVAVEAVPTVREADGLALSSRNLYLSPEERVIAAALNRVLAEVAARLAAGKTAGAGAIAWGLKELEAAGFTRIDYLEVRDAETLGPVETAARPARVLAAVWLGQIRLIDNMAVEPAG